MKVRCKKFIDSCKDEEFKTTKGILNDKEYIVLGVHFSERERKIYIEDSHEELPGYFDIREFEILSNYIPSNWSVEYVKKFDCLSLYPKAWLNIPDFWDRFVDDEDPEMMALFEREKEIIYREEPN